jgi:tight adherence protein C
MFVNFLAAVATFFTITLFALLVVRGPVRPAEARLRGLAGGRRDRAALASMPFGERVLSPVIESFGKIGAALLPNAFLRRTERKLILAGQPMKSQTFYTVMLLAGAMFAGLYLALVFSASDGAPSALALLPAVLLGAMGMYLATFWLSARARGRQLAMLRGLPDSMDLLTVCVEAGLGLDAAFHRVAEKQRGPLVDEIRQMLREIGLGKARRDALLDLAERTQLEDVRSFANAVIQAEQLGTSLAQVLRAQSQRLRVRRRQRAEQEARRVPVKMVFPLVLCLMPSLFIFILGPIIVNVARYLSDS